MFNIENRKKKVLNDIFLILFTLLFFSVPAFAENFNTADFNVTALTHGGGTFNTADFNVTVLFGSGEFDTADFNVSVGNIFYNVVYPSIPIGQIIHAGGPGSGGGGGQEVTFLKNFDVSPAQFTYTVMPGTMINCGLVLCELTVTNTQNSLYYVILSPLPSGSDSSYQWFEAVFNNVAYPSYIYTLEPLQTKKLYFRVKVPQDATYGIYKFAMQVYSSDVNKTVPFNINVGPIGLPQTPPALQGNITQPLADIQQIIAGQKVPDLIDIIFRGSFVLEKEFLGIKAIPNIVILALVVTGIYYFSTRPYKRIFERR